MKIYRCKLGTIPALIQLFRKYRIREGLIIRYREDGHYGKWKKGRVWKVNPAKIKAPKMKIVEVVIENIGEWITKINSDELFEVK